MAQRVAEPPAEHEDGEPPLDSLEQLFSSLRSGAANVAGVTFQIAATAWLLAAGRAGSIDGLEVVSVMPEGFEDVDCELSAGMNLLVQTKERGVGSRRMGVGEVAKIIAHAAPALTRETDRFAILTNGRFGGTLPTTGFGSTVDHQLGALGQTDPIRELLIDAVRSELISRELEPTAAKGLIARTHLVVVDGDIGQQTSVLLEQALNLHPAVAALVRAEVLRDLGDLASKQRAQTLASALRRSVADLDVASTRVLQAVDVPTLEEAIGAGVCEPADYLAPSSTDITGFYAGVDVIPAHVAAGFDVIRPEETTAVLDGLVDRRDVVIAGPSGSGKSALLWRSAHLVRRGVRVVRVLRVAAPEEVELLVRHVRRQMPSEAGRVLVVADDLGRDRMAAWPEARRRLAQVPGVLLLGAARREDLTPQISASAVVVDPRLTESAARCIYDAIEEAGVPTTLAPEEAVLGADGLLMEFIALTTTGHRLHDVLATQVAPMQGTEDSVRREALRIVCAAHLLGSAVPADALPDALGVAPEAVGEAMARLAGEHLVIAEGRFWHGLHDLRTEVLFDLLHESPPPTVAASYGRALSVLPRAAQGPGARRAAVRLGRTLAKSTPALRPTDRLEVISDALAPIAEALRDQLRELSGRPVNEMDAAYAASLIEAADRLDTIAYVHAVLPFLEQHRRPTLDVTSLAHMTYASAVDGLVFDGPLAPIAELARRLPERASSCAAAVRPALTPVALAHLMMDADLRTGIRLCEAAEGIASLDPAVAKQVYDRVIGGLPAAPGSSGTRADADRRAQLVATLASLADLRGDQVAIAFGAMAARAADAIASDDYGCSVELTFKPSEPPSDVAANLARTYTYSSDQMLVAQANVFARRSDDGEPTAYGPQPGNGHESVNGQAVLFARRLFDACPEVDHVDIEVWQANRKPVGPDAIKSLRAGIIRRAPQVARSVAFQAGVAEAIGAENWTRRLREQATVALDLTGVLRDLPRRVAPSDNSARRKDWIQRVITAATKVASLPGKPSERAPVVGAAGTAALSTTASSLDEQLRAPDRSRSALDLLSGALQHRRPANGKPRWTSARGCAGQAARR
jgi:hypothetical protein